jgi:hypothetical protein
MSKHDSPAQGGPLAPEGSMPPQHFADLAWKRERKARRFHYHVWHADRMLKRDRKWFRVSEIADQCAEIPGSVELDQDKRALALEKLRTAILEGEFNDPKGRSKVACLHSSPVIPIRFHQYGAGMSDDFLKLTSHLWISRADCSAWFSRKGYEFPKEWVKTEEQEKQTPRGPKPIFRQPIRNAVFELMGHHGDLTVDDPVWSRQADVEKAVRDKLAGNEPSPSTLRLHVSAFIEEWRRDKGR